MHLVFTCHKAVPIKPILTQLDKQNIVYEVVDDSDQVQLWVKEEELVGPVFDFYEQYLNQYQNRLSINNLKNTPITTAVLLVTFITAVITQLGQQWIDWFLIAKIQYYPRSWFFYDGAINIWRFISPIFLHFGIEHLIFNSLSFWYLGSMLERNTGRLFFLGLIVVLASISNVSQLISDGPLFGGLSGVVYGFIGFLFLYKKFIKDLNIPKGLPVFAVVWMLLGMTDILASIGFGSMANTAHLSGLLAGLATFAVYKIMTNKESTHEPR
jgi:GlpG protein